MDLEERISNLMEYRNRIPVEDFDGFSATDMHKIIYRSLFENPSQYLRKRTKVWKDQYLMNLKEPFRQDFLNDSLPGLVS